MNKKLLGLLGIIAILAGIGAITRRRESAASVELWAEATDPII